MVDGVVQHGMIYGANGEGKTNLGLALNQRVSKDELWLLELEDRDVITDIYLFFDYDPHVRSANDDKLLKQLALLRFSSSMNKNR